MTSVLLLRGVNVGGANRLAMADLRAALESLGGRGIETLIQSGNAVFEGRIAPEELTAALARTAGLKPEAIVLDGAAFLDLVASNPFPEAEADPKSLHVFFLPRPAQASEAEIAAACGPGERARLSAAALWLHTPRYLSGSTVAPRLDRLLGVRPTGRNWSTVTRIADRVRARA